MNDLSTKLEPHWERIFSFFARTAVWLSIFVLLYVLRGFFLLIFLTFVFAYMQAHGVHLLEGLIPRRGLRATLVALIFLGIITAVGTYVFPRVKSQATLLADRFPAYVRAADEQLLDFVDEHPTLEPVLIHATNSTPTEAQPGSLERSPSLLLGRYLLQIGSEEHDEKSLSYLVEILRGVGRAILATGSAFLLSLLFSFLIVLDLPRLLESTRNLRYTKLRFFYEEVGDSVYHFGKVLGRALEAQVIIALINTILTSGIILYFGLGDKLTFLSVIVFLCSFIPVAGVFISSVPICLLVLVDYGVSGMLLAALLVWIVHLIEAYVLNPRIFGQRLHVNPVLVLIILTVAGKLFHVWGLVLGLPVCTYVFQHAIRYHDRRTAA